MNECTYIHKPFLDLVRLLSASVLRFNVNVDFMFLREIRFVVVVVLVWLVLVSVRVLEVIGLLVLVIRSLELEVRG